MKTYSFLAPGFEEIEAITPIDVLRRAGADVTVVAVSDTLAVTGANGMTVMADIVIGDIDADSLSQADWLVLPGGMPGADNLAANPVVKQALHLVAGHGGNIAAICASPGVVLASAGLLDGREATCYPGFESMGPKVVWTRRSAVISNPVGKGCIVTGRGPGASMSFALAIVQQAYGVDKAREIASAMMYVPADDRKIE